MAMACSCRTPRADHRDPQQLALQHPHLARKHDHHGDGFPRGGMLPQRDVGALRESPRPRCGSLSRSSTCSTHSMPAAIQAHQPIAPAEGQERARDHEQDRVEERPRKTERGEDQRADELHDRPRQLAAAGGDGSLNRAVATGPRPLRTRTCSCASNARRLARSCGSSSITITSSKNASTAGRSCARRPSAAVYWRCAVAAATASRSARIASYRRTSAASFRYSHVDLGGTAAPDLRRMLAMRLLAAVRLDGFGQLQEGRQRLQARVEVQRRRRARGQHRVEHLGGDRGAARAPGRARGSRRAGAP